MKKYLLLLLILSFISEICLGQIKSVIIENNRLPVLIDLKNYSKIDTLVYSNKDTIFYIKEIGAFKIVDNNPQLNSTSIEYGYKNLFYYRKYILLKQKGIPDSSNEYYHLLSMDNR